MDKMFEALKGINVNLNSSDLIEVAKYWYMVNIVDNISALIGWNLFILIITIGTYMCVKKSHEVN